MMPFGRARRFAVLISLVGIPLLAACGGGNNNKPKPTPTATHAQAPTATQTATNTAIAATATATQAAATATATGILATATATTAVATATATDTVIPPTSTATLAPPTATATATATGIPTGTATATITATATPTGTAAATITFTPTGTPTGTAAATVTPTPGPEGIAHGSVGQVYVTDAAPGTALNLLGPGDSVVQSGTADSAGSFIFRDVPVGDGYTVVDADQPGMSSGPVTSTAWDNPPDASFYQNQAIESGYGYLTTRDGTTLAINVTLPGPINGGPYPTVIEYSGYDPANPDSLQPSELILSNLGYATVGINMRGTGCSGGAFQYFEPLQSTDGYDAVEIIAAQPWVKFHEVGLVGLSYPGITQLFVAQLEPPHLASIAPLSVIADTGRGTLYPGGILNDGFAVGWAMDRQHDAQPAPNGQPWANKRINNGDQVCLNNQKLRLQAPNILQMISDNMYYNPAVADPVSPATFVHNINVPVFLAGAWQDEQVGAYFATMLDRFTGTDKLHFTVVNGGHTEPLIPDIFARWLEFLSFYVRREIPQTPALAPVVINAIGSMIFTTPNLTLPPDRFTNAASYEDALAQYEAEPQLRVLFESGAGGASPGQPYEAFEHSFASWPVPSIVATRWYFGDGGTLTSDTPTGDGADSFIYDPSRDQVTTYTGNSDGIWAALPAWDWEPLPDGKALAYATAPLAQDTVMIGSGSVDLWLKATQDVDLQVTLSEIRPDGQEVYVQTGWLRASRRKLDDSQSTELRPVPTGALADVQPVPSDHYDLTRVELFPFAYAFRAGSRLRISVEAPGGDRPLWQFMAQAANGTATVDISHSVAAPSSIVLPVVPGVDVPTPLPPCPGLRGEPCRNYVELTNTPG
jgi:predicted acyl esterase